MFLILLALSSCLVASQHVSRQTDSPKIQQLVSNLARLNGESNSLDICVKTVEPPLNDVIQFYHNLREINSLIATIGNRIEASSDIMDIVMVIPYVGQAAAAVLGPTTAVLNGIQTGLETVDGIVAHYVNSLANWTAPLEKIHERIPRISGKIHHLTEAIEHADVKAKAAKSCTEKLPIRPATIHSLEETAGTIDVIPHGLQGSFSALNTGCLSLKETVTKWTPRKIPLGPVKDVLRVIVDIFGPIGRFLDTIDHVLRTKFCLIESIKVIVHGVEYLAKEVAIGAEHVVDGLGHAWVEVKEKAGRVLGHLGGDIEHELISIGDVIVKDFHTIINGAEHLGHEIINGVENVGHKIVDGAKHAVEDIKHAGETVVNEVVHIGHVVEEGAKIVENKVVEGAKLVGEEVVKGFSAIGNAFKHLFGRRNSQNAWRLIDGRLYKLIDEQVYPRHQRALDICISINDILKGLSFPIGGLLTKVESIIGKLFHGKLPFHIPGLSNAVLSLGTRLLSSGLDLTVPVDSTTVLALPETEVDHAIARLGSNLFEKELDNCAK